MAFSHSKYRLHYITLHYIDYKSYYPRVLKSRVLSVSLAHFDVISRSHAHTSISHALALFWKVTLLFLPSEVLIIVTFLPSPSMERVNLPGFNKLVRFRRFQKCKIQKFSKRACPQTPLDDARAFRARSANKLTLWKNINLRALLSI